MSDQGTKPSLGSPASWHRPVQPTSASAASDQALAAWWPGGRLVVVGNAKTRSARPELESVEYFISSHAQLATAALRNRHHTIWLMYCARSNDVLHAQCGVALRHCENMPHATVPVQSLLLSTSNRSVPTATCHLRRANQRLLISPHCCPLPRAPHSTSARAAARTGRRLTLARSMDSGATHHSGSADCRLSVPSRPRPRQ